MKYLKFVIILKKLRIALFKEIALIGTTASGKSSVAHEVAKHKNGIILSLDSLSIYKHIDIASAKVSQNELNEVKYFGIDVKNPDEDFCVGDFIIEYKKAKNYAQLSKAPLIITGGSSFYLKAMLDGLSQKIPRSEHSLDEDEIWELAKKIDNEFVLKFSKNDSFRLQKWIDIYNFCGFCPTEFLKQNTNKPIIEDIKIYEISWEKEQLKDRIIRRVEIMFELGLQSEAKKLFEKYGRDLKSLNCIGLKEFKDFFDGKSSLEEIKELVIVHTNQLAKKQRTFNKKFEDKVVGSVEEIREKLNHEF